MKINANVKLYYVPTSGVHEGPERLGMKIKFKDPNKFFRVTRKHVITSVSDGLFGPNLFDSYDKYLEDLDEILSDREGLIAMAKGSVKTYFEDQRAVDSTQRKKDAILAKMDDNGKFDVKVTIE